MRKILGFGFVIFILILGVMFITNPAHDDFRQFLKKKIAEKMAGNNESLMESIMESTGADVALALGDKFTVRQNFFVCSIYTITVPGTEWNYLGVFGFFVPLQKETPFDFLELQSE